MLHDAHKPPTIYLALHQSGRNFTALPSVPQLQTLHCRDSGVGDAGVACKQSTAQLGGWAGALPVGLVLCVNHVHVRVLCKLRGGPGGRLGLRGQLRQIRLALRGGVLWRLLDRAEGIVVELDPAKRVTCATHVAVFVYSL